MCKSIADGGQRCAAHTRADMEAAAARYASDPTNIDYYDALQAARAEYAATPSGQEDLEQQLTAAPANGTRAIDLAAALRRGALIRERNQAIRSATAEQTAATELATRLTTMSPVDVDTELAQKWAERYRLEDQIQNAKRSLGFAESRFRGSRRDPLPHEQKELDDARARIAAAEAKLEKHVKAMEPYSAEFRRRGGWSRYYLVVGSGNGHLHESMNCSSCFPTTRYAWNPELSGASQDKAIEEFGETCCTVCMPDAPANPNFRGPGRRDRAAQDERAKEKADRAAAKEAKAITHKDGGRLRDGGGSDIRTLVTARNSLVSDSAYIAHLKKYRDDPAWAGPNGLAEHQAHYDTLIRKYETAVFHIEEAIAAKTGQTVDEVRAEAAPKIARKVKKDEW